MFSKKIIIVLFFIYFNNVESATILERSYEYVKNLGKNLGPSFVAILDCMGEEEVWQCTKLKAGKILDGWDEDLEKQRRSWQATADAEVAQSGRSLEEMPSKLAREVETSLTSVAELIQHGMARAYGAKKHDDGGGIDSITISTSSHDKKKEKKKKKKPAKIQLVQMPVMMDKTHDTGRSLDRPVQSWVIGHAVDQPRSNDVSKLEDNASSVEALEASDEDSGESSTQVSSRRGRGLLEDAWSIGEKALDTMAEHAIASDNSENGVESDKSSFEEQRGKKKKKKKAILKLLLLGAVLKAKIGTLLQILSFKLQVKFFIIALLGLAINLARFWIDLKKQHQQQPQKVIYYEHAQHQHHYDEHEEPGWGPWSRSMDPEESDVEIDLDLHNSPYRAHERNAHIVRPAPLS